MTKNISIKSLLALLILSAIPAFSQQDQAGAAIRALANSKNAVLCIPEDTVAGATTKINTAIRLVEQHVGKMNINVGSLSTTVTPITGDLTGMVTHCVLITKLN